MARRKLSQSDILERLRMIDALTRDGWSIADAVRVARALPAEYERWRSEYDGLLRTLGPLPDPPSKVMKKLPRAGLSAQRSRTKS